jgi:hypothetical protein
MFDIFGVAKPLVSYGVIGSAVWFLIPWLVDWAVAKFFPGAGGKTRWVTVIGAIPLILICFALLGDFAVTQSIQDERPAELKTELNSASSGFLSEKVVFEEKDYGGIGSIRLMRCRPETRMDIMLSLPGKVAFLDDQYQMQHRLQFDQNRFMRIEPIRMGGTGYCGYIAYKLFEGVYLYDSNGNEKWNITRQDKKGTAIDGVRAGDVDGDSQPDIVIYHRYREGIHLVDGEGNTIWKYPVHALGHLEVSDVDEDGKAEIIFSNSNNANGVTEYSTLDEGGAIADRLKITTTSYEFSIVRWPDNGPIPNLLLTEKNKIRIVDLNGNTVIEVDAPGCRPFGKVAAASVKLNKTELRYLAVKKSLHPDLSVLYVYNPGGKLVFQKTEVIKGVLAPTLVSVPADTSRLEKLIVGSSRDNRSQILEYSLTR